MLATKKSSDKTLPQDITTEELMKVDYHFNYSENELKADWKRLKKITFLLTLKEKITNFIDEKKNYYYTSQYIKYKTNGV